MKKITAALAAALFLITLTGCAAAETNTDQADVIVTDGWVRIYEGTEAAGGMTGGFATITNNLDTEITLVGASSAVAMMAEVHEVAMVDGKMQMQAKDGGITIAPGETVTLEPGGLHVMLMGLKEPLVEGQEIPLTLDFDGVEDVDVVWPGKTSLAGDEEYVSGE
jgi:copper(I)-binding protein